MIIKNLEEVKATIAKLETKLDLIQKTSEVLIEEAKVEKVLDLQDKAGDRKYVKTKAELYANTFLTDKMSYVLGKVVNKDDDEEVQLVKIDGA